jgi:hypothetical protein
MMDGRDVALRSSMVALSHGSPLLVGGVPGHFHSIARHDDDGIYVIIPLLSRLFGVSDPLRMMRDFYLALSFLGVALYPTIFYRLTSSVLAGLASPLMFGVCLLSVARGDIYWIPAWGALMLLPLVFFLLRDWPRYGLVLAAGITLVASLISSIRSYSGLGIAVAVGIALLLQRWRWWRVLATLTMLVCVYASINLLVISPIQAERDHWLGRAAEAERRVASPHTMWHTAYAGLGFLPNGYGLYYGDDISNKRVQHDAPGTIFLSRRYETLIREAYLRFAREHPLEIVRQYAAKSLVVIADAAPYLLIVLMTLPAVLLLAPDRRIVRLWCILAIPAAIDGLLPPLLAVPLMVYEDGLYGALGVVGIIGLCWALKLVDAAWRERGGLRLKLALRGISWGALARGATPGWRSVRVSAIAIGVLIAVSVGGHFVRQEAVRWLGDRYGSLMERIGA